MSDLKFFRTSPLAKIPTRAEEEAGGLDLYSVEAVVIPARGRALIDIGLQGSFNKGYVVRIQSRSGLGWKNGLHVGAGLIDSSYTGDWKVLLFNHTDEDFHVSIGDRIAQALVLNVDLVKPTEVTSLDQLRSRVERGGFGSTGSN